MGFSIEFYAHLKYYSSGNEERNFKYSGILASLHIFLKVIGIVTM